MTENQGGSPLLTLEDVVLNVEGFWDQMMVIMESDENERFSLKDSRHTVGVYSVVRAAVLGSAGGLTKWNGFLAKLASAKHENQFEIFRKIVLLTITREVVAGAYLEDEELGSFLGWNSSVARNSAVEIFNKTLHDGDYSSSLSPQFKKSFAAWLSVDVFRSDFQDVADSVFDALKSSNDSAFVDPFSVSVASFLLSFLLNTSQTRTTEYIERICLSGSQQLINVFHQKGSPGNIKLSSMRFNVVLGKGMEHVTLSDVIFKITSWVLLENFDFMHLGGLAAAVSEDLGRIKSMVSVYNKYTEATLRIGFLGRALSHWIKQHGPQFWNLVMNIQDLPQPGINYLEMRSRYSALDVMLITFNTLLISSMIEFDERPRLLFRAIADFLDLLVKAYLENRDWQEVIASFSSVNNMPRSLWNDYWQKSGGEPSYIGFLEIQAVMHLVKKNKFDDLRRFALETGKDFESSRRSGPKKPQVSLPSDVGFSYYSYIENGPQASKHSRLSELNLALRVNFSALLKKAILEGSFVTIYELCLLYKNYGKHSLKLGFDTLSDNGGDATYYMDLLNLLPSRKLMKSLLALQPWITLSSVDDNSSWFSYSVSKKYHGGYWSSKLEVEMGALFKYVTEMIDHVHAQSRNFCSSIVRRRASDNKLLEFKYLNVDSVLAWIFNKMILPESEKVQARFREHHAGLKKRENNPAAILDDVLDKIFVDEAAIAEDLDGPEFASNPASVPSGPSADVHQLASRLHGSPLVFGRTHPELVENLYAEKMEILQKNPLSRMNPFPTAECQVIFRYGRRCSALLLKICRVFVKTGPKEDAIDDSIKLLLTLVADFVGKVSNLQTQVDDPFGCRLVVALTHYYFFSRKIYPNVNDSSDVSYGDFLETIQSITSLLSESRVISTRKGFLVDITRLLSGLTMKGEFSKLKDFLKSENAINPARADWDGVVAHKLTATTTQGEENSDLEWTGSFLAWLEKCAYLSLSVQIRGYLDHREQLEKASNHSWELTAENTIRFLNRLEKMNFYPFLITEQLQLFSATNARQIFSPNVGKFSSSLVLLHRASKILQTGKLFLGSSRFRKQVDLVTVRNLIQASWNLRGVENVDLPTINYVDYDEVVMIETSAPTESVPAHVQKKLQEDPLRFWKSVVSDENSIYEPLKPEESSPLKRTPVNIGTRVIDRFGEIPSRFMKGDQADIPIDAQQVPIPSEQVPYAQGGDEVYDDEDEEDVGGATEASGPTTMKRKRKSQEKTREPELYAWELGEEMEKLRNFKPKPKPKPEPKPDEVSPVTVNPPAPPVLKKDDILRRDVEEGFKRFSTLVVDDTLAIERTSVYGKRPANDSGQGFYGIFALFLDNPNFDRVVFASMVYQKVKGTRLGRKYPADRIQHFVRFVASLEVITSGIVVTLSLCFGLKEWFQGVISTRGELSFDVALYDYFIRLINGWSISPGPNMTSEERSLRERQSLDVLCSFESSVFKYSGLQVEAYLYVLFDAFEVVMNLGSMLHIWASSGRDDYVEVLFEECMHDRVYTPTSLSKALTKSVDLKGRTPLDLATTNKSLKFIEMVRVPLLVQFDTKNWTPPTRMDESLLTQVQKFFPDDTTWPLAGNLFDKPTFFSRPRGNESKEGYLKRLLHENNLWKIAEQSATVKRGVEFVSIPGFFSDLFRELRVPENHYIFYLGDLLENLGFPRLSREIDLKKGGNRFFEELPNPGSHRNIFKVLLTCPDHTNTARFNDEGTRMACRNLFLSLACRLRNCFTFIYASFLRDQPEENWDEFLPLFSGNLKYIFNECLLGSFIEENTLYSEESWLTIKLARGVYDTKSMHRVLGSYADQGYFTYHEACIFAQSLGAFLQLPKGETVPEHRARYLNNLPFGIRVNLVSCICTYQIAFAKADRRATKKPNSQVGEAIRAAILEKIASGKGPDAAPARRSGRLTNWKNICEMSGMGYPNFNDLLSNVDNLTADYLEMRGDYDSSVFKQQFDSFLKIAFDLFLA